MTTDWEQTRLSQTGEISDRIRGVAFQAFMEKGYPAVSMLEIANRARISKRDLYAQFANKQAVLIACIKRRSGLMRARPDLPVPRDHTMLAEVLSAFASTVVTEASDPAVIAMFQFAISEAKRSPEVADAVETLGRGTARGALVDLIAQAQASGLIGEGEPPELAERYLGLLWEGLLIALIMGVSKTPTLEQIHRRAAKATAAFLALHALPA